MLIDVYLGGLIVSAIIALWLMVPAWQNPFYRIQFFDDIVFPVLMVVFWPLVMAGVIFLITLSFAGISLASV